MEVACEVLELPTLHEFRIAREGARLRRSVWVRLVARDGVEGWGEAAATPYYGETAETVLAAVRRVRETLAGVGGLEGGAAERLEGRVLELVGEQPAARAAISAALHDLRGRRAGQPVWRLWGLEPEAPVSSFTLGIDAPDVMREKVREAAGYPVLKLKVGSAADETILRVVREAAPHARLRVDANTGWVDADIPWMLRMLEEYGVELIEQPLPPDDLDGLARVRKLARVPVIADESCRDTRDIARLEGCVDGINIKLAKCGSLLEANRMVDEARARGLQVMLGCMVESTLGIAAAVQLAPRVDYVDLDGAALLAADPFRGPGLEPDGRLRFNSEPGLGVRQASASSS